MLYVLFLHCALDLQNAFLRHTFGRMHQRVRKIAIVGHKDEPARMKIEATHREHARGDGLEVSCTVGRPSGSTWSSPRDAACGMHSTQIFGEETAFAIDFDLIAVAHFRSELRNDFSCSREPGLRGSTLRPPAEKLHLLERVPFEALFFCHG